MTSTGSAAAAASRERDDENTIIAIGRSPVFGWLVRAGFAARGLTYGIVGGIALALALGAGSAPKAPNQQGALALIASAPLGRVAIFVIAIGLLAYAVWKIGQGVLGQRLEASGGGRPWDRVANLAGGLVYLGFFAVAAQVLAGDGSSDSNGPKQAAAGVLSWPGGPGIVGVAGVVLIAVSVYQVACAVRSNHVDEAKTDEMNATGRDFYRTIGRIGLIARAVVFALIGYFVVRTAINYKPSDAVGLDGALARIHGQPYGSVLLGLAAAGLLVFALFSLFEARYREL